MSKTKVDCLVDIFDRSQIKYSQWKSNIDLSEAVAGEIDIDLLVDRSSLQQVISILSNLDFKLAENRWGIEQPGIAHYYAFDPKIEQFIHVHLFSRVITGESFVKSHQLPFEQMLLENTSYIGHIKVASKSAELVLFTLRMFVKYGSSLDMVLLYRQSEKVKAELCWLLNGADLSESLALLKIYCPVVEEKLFIRCVETIKEDGGLLNRIYLARCVRRRLKVYAKYSFLERLIAYGQWGWIQIKRKLWNKQKNRVLQSGGAMIAIVGADATGKSTLVKETAHWLENVFTVRVAHTGKPPSTWLTLPINIFIPLLRHLVPGSRVTQVKMSHHSGAEQDKKSKVKGLGALLYALRAVTLAWDRRTLIIKSIRASAKGELVICDRYPSLAVGAMDSPRLQEMDQRGLIPSIYNYLARLEIQLYKQIPPPDIALKLNVSIETAKKRNQARSERDEDGYLEMRHRQSRDWHMEGTNYIYEIDTERTLRETFLNVKRAVWESL